MTAELWDATPGVCCQYFQLGACEHTESFEYDGRCPECGADDEAYSCRCEPEWTPGLDVPEGYWDPELTNEVEDAYWVEAEPF